MKFATFKWYFVTRAVGLITAFYELVVDHSPERGTIIIAAFGLMGFDWVSRRVVAPTHEEDDDHAK